MTTLRTAAQQALEALMWHDETVRTRGDDEAIEALRAALEQPEQEPQCNPHPNAPHGFLRNASHTEGRYVCACEYWQPYEAALEQPDRAQKMRDAGYTRRPTLREMAEQQEQEPVEIKPPNPEGATQCIVRWFAETPAGWVGAWNREALEQFTHPPRREWRGLTEEEIHDCFQQRHKDKAIERRMIARAIEAALRSKNHD